MESFNNMHDVTKFLYFHYLCTPIYFIQGIQYCAEYLQAQKAKNEYLEKKEKAEKTKEALLKTTSLLYTL